MQRSRASAFNLVYPYVLILANKTLQTSSFAAAPAPPVSKTSCLGKSYLLSAPSNIYICVCVCVCVCVSLSCLLLDELFSTTRCMIPFFLLFVQEIDFYSWSETG